jgi:CRISPR/Cas system CSM-associated protein Csm2 small subunit
MEKWIGAWMMSKEPLFIKRNKTINFEGLFYTEKIFITKDNIINVSFTLHTSDKIITAVGPKVDDTLLLEGPQIENINNVYFYDYLDRTVEKYSTDWEFRQRKNVPILIDTLKYSLGKRVQRAYNDLGGIESGPFKVVFTSWEYNRLLVFYNRKGRVCLPLSLDIFGGNVVDGSIFAEDFNHFKRFCEQIGAYVGGIKCIQTGNL